MAKEKKYKFPAVITPVGIAKFTYLDKADTGWDGKSDPKFKTRILFEDTEEVREWIKETMALGLSEAKKAGIKVKKIHNVPFKFPEDQDEDDYVIEEGKDHPKLDEDHAGRIFINLASAYKPGLIDSERSTLADAIRIMSGDKIRAKLILNPYEGLGSGISFRLSVVQLIEKNTSFSSGKVNTDGFDDVEGGYVSQQVDDEDEDEDF